MVGDRYGGEFPRELFRKNGITYETSKLPKSELYAECVAPLNAGRVELLDLPILRGQFLGLERRVARSGKESIDHGPGGHDDVANAVAGAVWLLAGRQERTAPVSGFRGWRKRGGKSHGRARPRRGGSLTIEGGSK